MTSTIIILPLIILAIMLVSGAIISLVTHIYVEKVEFSNSEAIVLVMDDETNPPTHDLKAEITVFPLEAPNRDIVYTDYDKSLLKISDDGIVTPLFYGETYVTVQSVENKAATATRKIIVTANHVHALKLNEYQKDWYEGDTAQFSVNVYPQEAENKSVTWSSSDTDILQIASNGMATAKGNGKVTITATSNDVPEVTASAEVVCHAKIRGLDFDDDLLQTSLTEVQFPTVAVSPDPCDATIKYSVDNARIAAVDELTGKLIFKTPGKVTVTVTGTDFKGNSVTGQKTIVSTMGYFVGPLFTTKEVKFADCAAGEEIPVNFVPKLAGTTKQINSIDYVYDPSSPDQSAWEYETGLIGYDEATMQFTLNGAFNAFNNYVYVRVHATVYDNAIDALNADYEDYFYITKTEVQNNAKVKWQRGADDFVELTAGAEATNSLTIADIGDDLQLVIENPDNMIVKIDSTQQVIAELKIQSGSQSVTLTGNEVTSGSALQLSVGTKVYNLNVAVNAKAQWIKLKYGDRQLEEGNGYQTLLGSLEFAVEVGRDDGKRVTTPVKYRVDGRGESSVEDGKITVTEIDQNTEIRIICDIDFAITVNKVTLADFGFAVTHSNSTGDTLNLVPDVASAKAEENLTIKVPKDSLNTITFGLNISDTENYLGGLGTEDDFKEIFKVEYAGSNLQIEHNLSTKQIIVTPGNSDFDEDFTVKCGDVTLNVNVVKINLESVEFTKGTESFDISKPEDVYKGYQQVRVFAKHSYYNGNEVDYFRMPIKAISSITTGDTLSVEKMQSTISWTISRYKKNSLEKVLTTQFGDAVTVKDASGDKQYTIAKEGSEYVLKDGANIVSGQNGKNDGGYIWIDTFSEAADGYVRIYFGDFGGLSEVDVQNDYFGDFGEQGAKWKQVADLGDLVEKDRYDNPSGRSFKASENAYTFLQIEAGDGVNGSKANRHFNFNILADPDGSKIVNVFNAAGYCNYKYGNVVLHNNLYADGELSSDLVAQNADLILKPTVSSYDDTQVTKNLIYGNGYQVNMKVLSDMVKDSDLNVVENTGKSTNLGTVYNVTLKGGNPPTEDKSLTPYNYRMYFVLGGAYYSDLQYYSKLNPKNGKVFMKNTVMRYVANAAIQIWGAKAPDPKDPYGTRDVFLENVVFAECMRAISIESCNPYVGIYFKGSLDILNYCSAKGLSDAYGAIHGGSAYNKEFTESNIKSASPTYLEWFGSDGSQATEEYRYYVDMGVVVDPFSWGYDVRYWDDTSQEYTTNNKSLPFKLKKLSLPIPSLFGMAVTTYDVLNTVDGGNNFTSRKMDELFTNNRDIRLLCQYKTIDGTKLEKNTEHIQWHMDKVHRDMSLIKNRTEDHIAALKESLKNVTWPDGTGTDGDGNVKAVAAAMNSLLSQAIVPGKREYSVV